MKLFFGSEQVGALSGIGTKLLFGPTQLERVAFFFIVIGQEIDFWPDPVEKHLTS